MYRFHPRDLAIAGFIASTYTVLSLVFQPISFGVYQVRIAEALTVLPFLTPAAIPGLFVGCLLANVIGGMGWLDILIGPLITLVAAVLTRWTYKISVRRKIMVVAAWFPLVCMWVGAVYLLNGFKMSWVEGIGALLSLAAGLVIWSGTGKIFNEVLSRDRFWTRLLAAIWLAGISIVLLRSTNDTYFIICGGLLVLSAVFGVAMIVWTRSFDGNLGMFLAPLPPVVLNAFGVSLYLAPIIGVEYWFCVQMIFVGQLLACYVIGWPLLLALHRRNVFG